MTVPIFLLLSACNPKAIPTVIFPAKPEPQVAAPPPAPAPVKATVNVFARDIVNPDAQGQASPVQVRVFLASEMSIFDGVSFEQVFEFEGQAFDIKPKLTKTVLPGSLASIELEILPDQKVIAVAAAFSDIGRTDWLAKIDIGDSNSRTINFILSDFSVRYEAQ